jgi:DNA-binding GntR family transcriptional regulator
MTRQTILRQQIYDEIKHAIITCALVPGEPVSENQFVDRFHVSKTPIREALTALVDGGLVEYIPNRGFSVTHISVKDIQEIFEARTIYETTLFKMALKNITAADIARLEEINLPASVGETDIEAFVKANFEFHLALASFSRNSRLLRHYTNLLQESQRLVYMDFSHLDMTQMWGHGHEKIISALQNRDEHALVAAIEESLQNARKRILGI